MKNQNLEVLRGVAIMMVLLAHSYFIPALVELRELFHFGRGVDLFFVLSGFLMGVTYLSKIDLSNFSIKEAYNFYIKRFCRLFPAVFFWASVSLVLSPILIKIVGELNTYRKMLEFFTSNVLFVGNFYNSSNPNPLGYWWSIGVEFQFYLILPVLIYLAGKNIYRLFILILLIITPPYLWNVENAWMFRMHSLFIGVLFWKVTTTEFYSQFRQIINGKKNQIKFFSILITLCLIAVSRALPEYVSILSTLSGIVFGFILILFYGLESGVLNRKVSAIFEFFGKIAFSLYLIHMLVFTIGAHYLTGIQVYILYPIAIFLAYMSQKYVEFKLNPKKLMI